MRDQVASHTFNFVTLFCKLKAGEYPEPMLSLPKSESQRISEVNFAFKVTQENHRNFLHLSQLRVSLVRLALSQQGQSRCSLSFQRGKDLSTSSDFRSNKASHFFIFFWGIYRNIRFNWTNKRIPTMYSVIQTFRCWYCTCNSNFTAPEK